MKYAFLIFGFILALQNCDSISKKSEREGLHRSDSIRMILFGTIDTVRFQDNRNSWYVERFKVRIINNSEVDTFFFQCFRDSFILAVDHQRKIKYANRSDWIMAIDGNVNILFNSGKDSLYENRVLPKTSKDLFYQNYVDSASYFHTDSVCFEFEGMFKKQLWVKNRKCKYGEIQGIELER